MKRRETNKSKRLTLSDILTDPANLDLYQYSEGIYNELKVFGNDDEYLVFEPVSVFQVILHQVAELEFVQTSGTLDKWLSYFPEGKYVRSEFLKLTLQYLVRKYPFEWQLSDEHFDSILQMLMKNHLNLVHSIHGGEIPHNIKLPALKDHLKYFTTLKDKLDFLNEQKYGAISFPINEVTRTAILHHDLCCELEQKRIEKLDDVSTEKSGNVRASRAQAVIAFYLIFQQLGISKSDDVTQKAKMNFIKFLSGYGEQNIRASLSNPFKTKSSKWRYDDLQVIRQYFEDLGLNEIVDEINKQLKR